MDYLRARYYDPSTAQFLTRDPIVAVTRSPYAYVAGNPLNRTDPSGLVFTNDGGGDANYIDQYQQVASEIIWRIDQAYQYGDGDPGHIQQIQKKLNQLRNIEEEAQSNDEELPEWLTSNAPVL